MVQTITLSDEALDDSSAAPKAVLETVYAAFRENGYSVPDSAKYEVPSHSDELVPNAGINPDFMVDGSDVADAITSGIAFPFSWSDAVEGARDTEGQHHMTTTFVRAQKTIEQTVNHLAETGQIDLAAAKIEAFCNPGVDPIEVTAYAVATYAKGWVAERIITATDRYSKGSQSNDEAGQDVIDTESGDYLQVKSVTYKKQKDDHLYYQWDMNGGLVIGDDYKAVAGKAVEGTDVLKTVSYRTHSSYTTPDGRTYRYIWW